MTEVNIIGAGGHCRSLIPLLEESELSLSAIFDDSYNPELQESILGYTLKGKEEDALQIETKLVLSVGDNQLRKELYDGNQAQVLEENIIAKEALIRENVTIDRSNQIFPFVFINSSSQIGNNNIINSKALIEHECVIGDHCHISVGAIISGRVRIGDSCFVGAGAIIKDKTSICNDVTIGAGAVVVKNIDKPGVYIGNPLKRIK